MSEMAFDRLNWMPPLLGAVVGLAAVGAYGLWQKRRALHRLADARLIPRLAPGASLVRPAVRLGLVTLGLLALTTAIIEPRWGQREQTVYRRGIDVMVVLDVSRSMLARDIAPSRLERAKLSISQDLLPALGGDRIGLVAFAGVASLKCPLTSDYGFFRIALDEATPESNPKGGTVIGDAIRAAADYFRGNLDTHKVILLVTDGEDQESYPVEAAIKVWDEKKIPIIAVALGDEREGARVPLKTDAGERFLEYQGQTVWSKANFDDLRRIAAVSKLNAFVPVGTKDFDLGDIYRTRIVPAIQAKELSETESVPLPSRYHPFAVAALALVLAESLMREGRPVVVR